MKTKFSWDKGVVLLLIVSTIIGSFITPYFATSSNISFVIQDVGEIMIIALPMTYLIIAGEIDLSVASIVGLTSASIGFAYVRGIPFGVSIIIGILV